MHKRTLAGPLEDADSGLMEPNAERLEVLHVTSSTRAFADLFDFKTGKMGFKA